MIAALAVVASAVARSSIPNHTQNWQYFLNYFPLFHLPSFLFGMALGRMYLFARPLTGAMNRLCFAASAIVLSLLLGYRVSLPSWLLTDAVLVPLYGLVILTGARLDGRLHSALAHPRLVLLGHASYSIYILHIAIVFWWQWIAHKVLRISLAPTVELVVILFLVIALSVCVFLYFERPLRRRVVHFSSRFARVRAVQPSRASVEQ